MKIHLLLIPPDQGGVQELRQNLVENTPGAFDDILLKGKLSTIKESSQHERVPATENCFEMACPTNPRGFNKISSKRVFRRLQTPPSLRAPMYLDRLLDMPGIKVIRSRDQNNVLQVPRTCRPLTRNARAWFDKILF